MKVNTEKSDLGNVNSYFKHVTEVNIDNRIKQLFVNRLKL